jgi:uncharacterized glyoxalase superfamily protein PhnB
MVPNSRLFPVLRYRNPRAAIDFLVAAFGCTVRAIHESPAGEIVHAELNLANGVLMLGDISAESGATGRTVSGGLMSLYVSVPFVDGHHDRAVAGGAVVTRPVSDTEYGSREYSCRDLEGYEWHFGTYDPFAADEADEPV